MYFKIGYLIVFVGILVYLKVTDHDHETVMHANALIAQAIEKVRSGDYGSACEDMKVATLELRGSQYFNQAADMKAKICGIKEAIQETKPDVFI